MNNEFNQDQYKSSLCFQGAGSIAENWPRRAVQVENGLWEGFRFLTCKSIKGILVQQDCDFLRLEERVQHSSGASIFIHREICPDGARTQSLQNKLGRKASADRLSLTSTPSILPQYWQCDRRG